MIKVLFLLFYLIVTLKAEQDLIVKGNMPNYLSSVTTNFTNVQAVKNATFIPDLDLGFVPQGIEKEKNDTLITGYSKLKYKCTIYRINEDNNVIKKLDISGCNHAGGISLMENKKLVVSDTKNIFILEKKNFNVLYKIPLKGKLRGSFITNNKKFWFIGVYSHNIEESFLYRYTDEQFQNSEYLDENIAIQRIPISLKAQGAGFDTFGNLWITTNEKNYGLLIKYDTDFQEVARYKIVRGLEDIHIIGDSMWIVSESGAKPYNNWSQVFPAYFQINLGLLK